VGQPHDPLTGRPLSRQTPQQIVDQVLALEPGTKIVVLAPLIENQPGEECLCKSSKSVARQQNFLAAWFSTTPVGHRCVE
jgi:excinuclease UvrABC ATPase subunit